MPDVISQKPPVFVVGTPRSGTTLTAKILGRHPNIFMPGETHFFDDIYSHREEYGNPTTPEARQKIASRLYDLYDRYYEPSDQERINVMFPSSDDLAEALSDYTSYSDIFRYFMVLQMEYKNKVRWGNNAPRDLFSVNDILDFFPDAKIIVCVRDVRAFLLSYQGKWQVTGGDHIDRLKKLYHPVVTSLLWKASMKLVPGLKDKIQGGNIIVVKYEKLVSSPDDVVRSICDVIGEDYQSEMLDVNTHNSSSSLQKKGIFSTSVDRWKIDLSAKEVAISQIICKKQLNELGYETVKTNAPISSILKEFITTPFALWRALDANKEMRGPLLPYLFKRITALVRS